MKTQNLKFSIGKSPQKEPGSYKFTSFTGEKQVENFFSDFVLQAQKAEEVKTQYLQLRREI